MYSRPCISIRDRFRRFGSRYIGDRCWHIEFDISNITRPVSVGSQLGNLTPWYPFTFKIFKFCCGQRLSIKFSSSQTPTLPNTSHINSNIQRCCLSFKFAALALEVASFTRTLILILSSPLKLFSLFNSGRPAQVSSLFTINNGNPCREVNCPIPGGM